MYLGVDADGLAALLAGVGEDGLVAGHAVRMLIPQDVALPGQALVALPAAEVLAVPVLVHGLGVLPAENKLEAAKEALLDLGRFRRQRPQQQQQQESDQ